MTGHLCTIPERIVGSSSAARDNATVSEGGLEHPFEWYITETVIYHQPKLTRRKPAGPAFGGQGGGGAGQSQRPGRVDCGNGWQ
jgi:hypothetical protein